MVMSNTLFEITKAATAPSPYTPHGGSKAALPDLTVGEESVLHDLSLLASEIPVFDLYKLLKSASERGMPKVVEACWTHLYRKRNWGNIAEYVEPEMHRQAEGYPAYGIIIDFVWDYVDDEITPPQADSCLAILNSLELTSIDDPRLRTKLIATYQTLFTKISPTVSAHYFPGEPTLFQRLWKRLTKQEEQNSLPPHCVRITNKGRNLVVPKNFLAAEKNR